MEQEPLHATAEIVDFEAASRRKNGGTVEFLSPERAPDHVTFEQPGRKAERPEQDISKLKYFRAYFMGKEQLLSQRSEARVAAKALLRDLTDKQIERKILETTEKEWGTSPAFYFELKELAQDRGLLPETVTLDSSALPDTF